MAAGADREFSGSIAQIYDRLLVPLIFQVYANDLSHRVERLQPRDVLETAAGTGVVTRVLASRLPDGTRVVATDLNEPMLNYAKAKQAPGGAVEWRHADALSLPFEDNAFDVVVCQFGAMFFPDKVKTFGEARRVLKPGGRFVFSVWDRISENEFADVVTEALAQRYPDDPPRFMARIPHGYHDVVQIRAELERGRVYRSRDRSGQEGKQSIISTRGRPRILSGDAAKGGNRVSRPLRPRTSDRSRRNRAGAEIRAWALSKAASRLS